MRRLARLVVAWTFYRLHGALHWLAIGVSLVLIYFDRAFCLWVYDRLCAASWRVLGFGGRLLERMARCPIPPP